MPPKRVIEIDSDEEEEHQCWVKEIVAKARGSTGTYGLVRWGADDAGNEYDEGEEEETWEEWIELEQTASGAVAEFEQDSRPPNPVQVQSEERRLLEQVADILRKQKGGESTASGAGQGDAYDPQAPHMLLAADVKLVSVSSTFKVQGDSSQLFPKEMIPQPIQQLSPATLTPSKRDFDAYAGSPGAMQHEVTMHRSRKQRRGGALEHAAHGLMQSPDSGRCVPLAAAATAARRSPPADPAFPRVPRADSARCSLAQDRARQEAE